MSGTPIIYKVSRKKRLKCYEVPLHELENLVRIGFGNDPELLNKYQEFDTDFETTVKRNISRIIEYNETNELTLFELRYGGHVIGFMALDLYENLLYSFGINREWRRDNILRSWVDEIKEKFDNLFACALSNKNERAIRFLVKNGMRIADKNDSMTHLIFNKWQ
jgi:hypothetical protein